MSAPTKVQLIGGHFQDLSGNVLANGYLRMFLSSDELVTGVGFICSGVFVQIQLDSAGSVASSTSTPPAANQFVWGNDQMAPTNSYYRVFGYAASGQLAFGPDNQQVIGNGGTFDVGTWIPNSVISWQPPIQPLTLEVNSVLAGSQTLLNLNAGSGITLTDNGSGQVTVASSLAALLLETNGTPNTSQTLLNLAAGTGITITNPSGGEVLISSTTSGSPSGSNVIFIDEAQKNAGSGFNGAATDCIIVRVPASSVAAIGSKVIVTINFSALGSSSIKMTPVLRRTLPGGTAFTDTTAITFGGSATPTFTGSTLTYTSDDVSCTIDSAHDNYFIFNETTVTGTPAYYTFVENYITKCSGEVTNGVNYSTVSSIPSLPTLLSLLSTQSTLVSSIVIG
jgi:hypothetical protein